MSPKPSSERVRLYGPDGRPLSVSGDSAQLPIPQIEVVAKRHEDVPAPAPKPPVSLAERLRERFDRFWEWVEAAGVEVPGVRTFLYLWRKVGVKGLVPLICVIGYPLGEYSLLSYAVNRTVPALANDFGVEFDAEEWSYHPFALKAVARNVRIKPEHDRQAAPIFMAGEVIFEGSLGSTWEGLKELLHFRRFHTFGEITVRHAAVSLERSLTGRLNWYDFVEAVPDEKVTELRHGLYQIDNVSMEDVSVHYVEHIPAPSGSGMIQTSQLTAHIDSVVGSVTDIRQVEWDGKRLPTKIAFSGRSAEGTLAMDGRIAFVADSGVQSRPLPSQPGIQSVSLDSRRAGGYDGPYYDITVALNNIGAAAFSRTLPNTSIVASSGTVRGHVRFVATSGTPQVCAKLTLVDVKWNANPDVLKKDKYDEVQRGLATRNVNGEFTACDNEIMPVPAQDNDPGQPRPAGIAAFATTITRKANADAPPAVQEAALFDSQKLSGRMGNAAVNDLTNHLASEMGQRASQTLGPQAGAQTSNEISKGAKSVGRGFKRLFGKK
jgi:hypothetical protein